ncbi:hypothetical protein KUV75_09265 [Qipengyuania gaetbuli]|uniref:hypothetical protein n=1 Tax=Qipengyuania gaetbuli TaxID=266952 RepID=UPI001C99A3F5|nr:hypothetical protein [Qipengyuania gaetbuli]MBY6015086.1 hypothetical protein [Qipengyuania gaetbuli]
MASIALATDLAIRSCSSKTSSSSSSKRPAQTALLLLVVNPFAPWSWIYHLRRS